MLSMAACGSGNATATPAGQSSASNATATPAGQSSASNSVASNSANPTPVPSINSDGTATATNPDNTNGLDGAASALADISSYQFSMTLAGDSFKSMGTMTGATAGAFTVKGTVMTAPAAAADITMGSYHIIEIGGFDYLNMGTGAFIKGPMSGDGMAHTFSPATMFSSVIYTSTASGYTKVGSETKNGAMADHYQATTAALAQYDSLMAGATWTSDVWLTQQGGYPVSMNITAKDASGAVVYQVIFDISHVNDPANTVSAPAV
jgi:hypothetical protein